MAGEVVEFLDHLRKPVTKKDREPGPYPYYGANGQQDSVADYIFNEPLILLAEDGGNFGDSERTIAYEVNGKCWVNNHAHVLRPTSKIDLRYLCRHLEKYDVTSFINGATRAKLNKSAAQEILISLPPLAEQKRIAEILDRADAIRRKREDSIKLTDTLLKSVFLDMFGDPVTNPKGWERNSIEDVCTKVTDGTHDTPQRVDEGVPYITGKHIRPFKIDFENCDYLSQEDHSEVFRRCNPECGDVLYTNIGVNLGTAAVNLVNYEFSMKNVALLKPKLDKITGHYFAYLLNNLTMKSEIKRIASLGGAQSFLGLQDIKRLKIIVPPIAKQIEFSNKVAAFVETETKLKSTLQKTNTLISSLTQRAFKGELTTSDLTKLETEIEAAE